MKKRTHLGMTKKGHDRAHKSVMNTLDVLLARRPKHGTCTDELSRLLIAAKFIGEARAHSVTGGGMNVLKLNEQVMKFRDVCLPSRGVATFDGLRRRRRSRRR